MNRLHLQRSRTSAAKAKEVPPEANAISICPSLRSTIVATVPQKTISVDIILTISFPSSCRPNVEVVRRQTIPNTHR